MNSTHILCSYVAIRILRIYPHTIQVWGIVSFVFAWVLSEPLCRQMESTPHFLFVHIQTLNIKSYEEIY